MAPSGTGKVPHRPRPRPVLKRDNSGRILKPSNWARVTTAIIPTAPLPTLTSGRTAVSPALLLPPQPREPHSPALSVTTLTSRAPVTTIHIRDTPPVFTNTRIFIPPAGHMEVHWSTACPCRLRIVPHTTGTSRYTQLCQGHEHLPCRWTISPSLTNSYGPSGVS